MRSVGFDHSNSAIYTGTIRHRRFHPSSHNFSYPIFMVYLDLDEINDLFSSKWYCSINKANVVTYRRDDFFGDNSKPLKESVIEYVSEYLEDIGQVTPPIVSVRGLMHLRYANFVFNPVVFYYCFDASDRLVAILSEITNTPWDERHVYVHSCLSESAPSGLKENKKYVFEFDKQFHVSPFNPMNMSYRWVFSCPDEEIKVHMTNTIYTGAGIDSTSGVTHFDATLTLEKKDFSKKLLQTLIQYPFMTVKVVLGIYWQALKLWIKRIPFYDHPNT